MQNWVILGPCKTFWDTQNTCDFGPWEHPWEWFDLGTECPGNVAQDGPKAVILRRVKMYKLEKLPCTPWTRKSQTFKEQFKGLLVKEVQVCWEKKAETVFSHNPQSSRVRKERWWEGWPRAAFELNTKRKPDAVLTDNCLMKRQQLQAGMWADVWKTVHRYLPGTACQDQSSHKMHRNTTLKT